MKLKDLQSVLKVETIKVHIPTPFGRYFSKDYELIGFLNDGKIAKYGHSEKAVLATEDTLFKEYGEYGVKEIFDDLSGKLNILLCEE